MSKDHIDLLHQANMKAQSNLTFDENNLIQKFLIFAEELLEKRRTKGITDKDRKRIDDEAFDSVPGSKDAYEKWLRKLQDAKNEIFAQFN